MNVAAVGLARGEAARRGVVGSVAKRCEASSRSGERSRAVRRRACGAPTRLPAVPRPRPRLTALCPKIQPNAELAQESVHPQHRG